MGSHVNENSPHLHLHAPQAPTCSRRYDHKTKRSPWTFALCLTAAVGMTLTLFCRFVSKTHCCRLNQLRSRVNSYTVPHYACINFSVVKCIINYKVVLYRSGNLSICPSMYTATNCVVSYPHSAIYLDRFHKMTISLGSSGIVIIPCSLQYCTVIVYRVTENPERVVTRRFGDVMMRLSMSLDCHGQRYPRSEKCELLRCFESVYQTTCPLDIDYTHPGLTLSI